MQAIDKDGKVISTSADGVQWTEHTGGEVAAFAIVVDAPGWYGDRAKVYSAYTTAEEAWRVVGTRRRLCVRKGDHHAGDRWLRVYEEVCPIVPRPAVSRG